MKSNKEELRDKYGRLLGTIITHYDGKQELRDRYGYLLGTYDPKRNETRDRFGNLIGKGNLLTLLLRP